MTCLLPTPGEQFRAALGVADLLLPRLPLRWFSCLALADNLPSFSIRACCWGGLACPELTQLGFQEFCLISEMDGLQPPPKGQSLTSSFKALRCRGLQAAHPRAHNNPRVPEPEPAFCCPLWVEIDLQFPRRMRGDLRPLVSLFRGSDSAVELWEPDAQDASSQPLGSSKCILREESSTPRSAGGTSRMGLEAPEPAALLPGVEAPPEATGEELPDLEAGAPWIRNQDSLPYEIRVIFSYWSIAD